MTELPAPVDSHYNQQYNTTTIDPSPINSPVQQSASLNTTTPTEESENRHQQVFDKNDKETILLPSGAGNQLNPVDQAIEIQKAPDQVVDREVEKVKADKREEKGEKPKGTIIVGIEDDQLWTMLRQFNNQISQVLSPPTKLPPNQPDLRVSTLPTVPFNSDALKNNVERLYASGGVSAIVFVREMQRLMSWDKQERNRTLAFAVAYLISWWFSLVIPSIVGLLIILVVFPESRGFFFPSIPPPVGVASSALDPSNKQGDESLLTGVENPVVHRSKAEQVEQQSKEVMTLAQRFGTKVLVGGRTKKNQGNSQVGRKEGEISSDSDDGEEEVENKIRGGELNSTENVGPDGKKLTEKQIKKKVAKEAKEKRDVLVGQIAKGLQDALGNAADFFERFNHALNPPTFYPYNQARIKIASLILLPILLIFSTVPAHIWSQLIGLGFFVGFFCQPLLIRAGRAFLRVVPLSVLEEKLDLRNSILSGVPTDAQVMLHLLRVSELNYKPLPYPPSAPTSKHLQHELDKPSIDEEMVESEEGIYKTGEDGEETGEEEVGLGEKAVRKTKGKFIGALRKGAAKLAKVGADVRDAKEDELEEKKSTSTLEKVGSKVDKLLFSGKAEDTGRPDVYPGKLNGTSGILQIHHSRSNPISTLSFIPTRSTKPAFEAPISNLVEIKKSGVWLARAALGYVASLTLEGMGLEMRFKSAIERKLDGIGKENEGIGGKHDETLEGEVWNFEQVARRDQLFTRLIAIGGQKWESL